jgi:long-chain fatty acid transport protein
MDYNIVINKTDLHSGRAMLPIWDRVKPDTAYIQSRSDSVSNGHHSGRTLRLQPFLQPRSGNWEMEHMTTSRKFPGIRIAAGAMASGLIALSAPAHAGGFGVHEQSTTFLGSAFAGAAAGGDISSMYWNSAAAAASPGCNVLSSYTLILGRGEESARSGLFVTGTPVAPGLTPVETDVGSDALVAASYLACQLSDKLYAGLALNAPFGLLTKPDDTRWAGSPIAVTSKVFSTTINPTIAYKLTPALTLGVGLQVEYFRLRLNHGAFPPLGPLAPARSFEGDDWGVGATVGLLWQPLPGTSIGLGYRSAVSLDVSGSFTRGPLATGASASLTLPEQVTFSFRQAVAPGWTLLGTVEWQHWSRLGDVAAVGSGCGVSGICEVLNLNYRDGWFYSLGAEYAWSPLLLLRAGVAYEISPIKDSTRDILVSDSNRVFLGVGASYKYSEHIVIDFAYAHIFFEDAPFCIASAAANGGSTHCNPATRPAAILLRGDADVSADLISVGLRYRF